MASGREDVARRVRGLLRVAADPGASPDEAASARAMAAKLTAKYELADEELVEYEEVGGLFDGMFASLRWGVAAREELEKAFALIDALVDRLVREEKGASRAQAANMVYGLVRKKLGGDTVEPARHTLKWRRDEIMTDYFEAFLRSEKKRQAKWRDGDEDEETLAYYEKADLDRVYARVAARVAMEGAPVTAGQVEKAVTRVRRERAYEARRAREQAVHGEPCKFCGEAGEIDVTVTYFADKRKTVAYAARQSTAAYWDENTVFSAHPECWGKAVRVRREAEA